MHEVKGRSRRESTSAFEGKSLIRQRSKIDRTKSLWLLEFERKNGASITRESEHGMKSVDGADLSGLSRNDYVDAIRRKAFEELLNLDRELARPIKVPNEWQVAEMPKGEAAAKK